MQADAISMISSALNTYFWYNLRHVCCDGIKIEETLKVNPIYLHWCFELWILYLKENLSVITSEILTVANYVLNIQNCNSFSLWFLQENKIQPKSVLLATSISKLFCLKIHNFASSLTIAVAKNFRRF